MSNDWLMMQLTDSAFPSGAFAHSGGLEAAWQLGEISTRDQLGHFMKVVLHQAATTGGPFVVAVIRAPQRLQALDELHDAMLTNPVTRRASTAQGQALLASATRIFDQPRLVDLQKQVRELKLPAHLPVIFGAVYGGFEIAEATAVSHYLYVQLRGLMSAAVRLGIVGPIEAQSMQHAFSADSEKYIRACLSIERAEDACQTSPMVDVIHSIHDRLYSRLFLT